MQLLQGSPRSTLDPQSKRPLFDPVGRRSQADMQGKRLTSSQARPGPEEAAAMAPQTLDTVDNQSSLFEVRSDAPLVCQQHRAADACGYLGQLN